VRVLTARKRHVDSFGCGWKELNYSVFWVITWREVVWDRRFGATYRVPSSTVKFFGQLDPWRWNRLAVPKRRFQTTCLRVITQKTKEFNRVWNINRWMCLMCLTIGRYTCRKGIFVFQSDILADATSSYREASTSRVRFTIFNVI
jgi:hypothetical protein